MKLAAVYFDDTVCIPGGKDVGGGIARQDLRESTFQASDGWDLERHIDGGVLFFRIWREGMPLPALVGGYGYTFVALLPNPAPVEGPAASGIGGTISEETMGDTEIPAAKILGPKRRRK